MSDYRSNHYSSDEYSKCKRRNSRSSTPDKCSSNEECDCYIETQCCKNYRKCRCSVKTRNEYCCKPNEKNKCSCSNCCSYKICEKKEKYDLCTKLKMFEDGVFNGKNEKIFFITIG